MKKSILAILAAALVFSSCTKEPVIGEGPVVTETRSVNNFTGISVALPGQVHFKIAPVYKVEITAQQNVINVIRTNVINGVLDIDVRHDIRLRRHEDIIINVQGPSSELFRLSGSADINVTGDLVTNQLQLEVSGSGNITVEEAVVTDEVDARISGSGSISVLNGAVKNEELRISGSGDMNLASVVAENAETHISGSGDMRVNVSNYLTAHISGSGSVYYQGNPIVNTHISGSGKVKPL
jgi:hypothetical protein